MAYLLGPNQCSVIGILVETTISEYKRIRNDLKLAENLPSVDYLSIVYIKLNKPIGDNKVLEGMIGSLRASDSVIVNGKEMIMFLPGTNKEGVIHIEEGFRNFMDDFYADYVSVSYSEDGKNKAQLVGKLKNYVKLKLGIDVDKSKLLNELV